MWSEAWDARCKELGGKLVSNKGLIGPVGGIGDIGLVKDVRRDTGTKAEVPSARMDLSAAASV